MMKPIELSCLFVPEEQVAMFDLGLDYQSEPRNVLFLNINGISEYVDDKGNQYTEILCNGSEYICTLSYETVKGLLEFT